MTWTYSGNPGASLRDQVRFLIGDTFEAEPQLTDEEIAFLLSETSDSAIHAAINACDSLIAKYSRLVSQSVGGISLSYSERLSHYEKLTNRLRRKLNPIPWAGGILEADTTTYEEDTTLKQPRFRRGMHDRG